MSLTSHGARQERLARAWRTQQQHTFRDSTAKIRVFLGILQERDDLSEFLGRLVDARDVSERHLDVVVALECGAA